MKINRIFNAFIDLKLFELEVLIICLVIKCVSRRKNKRSLISNKETL